MTALDDLAAEIDRIRRDAFAEERERCALIAEGVSIKIARDRATDTGVREHAAIRSDLDKMEIANLIAEMIRGER